MQRKKHIILKIFSIIAVIILLLGIVFFIYVKFGINHEIDLALIRTGASSVTKIYSFPRNDGIIDTSSPIEIEDERIFLENSEWCSYYDMPQYLIDAFIAIEDQRFYEHSGVDWPRTIKATMNYIFKIEKSGFGGSTITQQLIKNLTGDDMVTPKRKLEEIIRAINLEKSLGKNEILELYLNVIYLSQNAYGVQSASKLYFGKDASDMSLAECASLAAIIKNPTKYDPYKNPENNKQRRKIVLEQMLLSGKISQEEFNNAVLENVKISSSVEKEKDSGIYCWFTEKLITDVSEDLMKEYNLSKEGALMMINKGGLNIYSTMDTNVQSSVEKVFENYIAYLMPQNGKYPEGACVVLDSNNSDILGIAGGVGVKSANRIFNRATDAKRPLGSVIKPLSVYAPAIDANVITYASVYDDTPIYKNGNFWPHNATASYKGLVSANYALEHSINTVAVKILNDIGLENSFDFCKSKFKINLDKSDMSEAPLALGQLTNGESLLNVTNAYSVFSSGGYYSKPRSYLYVTDNFGNILLSNDYSSERVLDEDTVSIMNIMLKNVVKNGTARGITIREQVEVAGKTGTSGDNEDKWFIGYTPSYVCGIWVGYDTPQSINNGGNFSTSLFDAVMKDIYRDREENSKLFISSNIVAKDFCVDSGMLSGELCSIDPRLNRVQTGYFIEGTAPTHVCDRHKEVYIDSQSGEFANPSTHPLFKRRISLVDYMRDPIFNKFEPQDMKYLIYTR